MTFSHQRTNLATRVERIVPFPLAPPPAPPHSVPPVGGSPSGARGGRHGAETRHPTPRRRHAKRHNDRERDAAVGNRRESNTPRRFPARTSRSHRNPRRVRHEPVRRVRRPRQRLVREELYLSGGSGGRRGSHHDRGPRERLRPSPHAGGLPRAPRAPVRLLHPGDGAERGGSGEPESGSERARGPRVAGGQPLPLHRLPQHRQGRAGGRARMGGAS